MVLRGRRNVIDLQFLHFRWLSADVVGVVDELLRLRVDDKMGSCGRSERQGTFPLRVRPHAVRATTQCGLKELEETLVGPTFHSVAPH